MLKRNLFDLSPAHQPSEQADDGRLDQKIKDFLAEFDLDTVLDQAPNITTSFNEMLDKCIVSAFVKQDPNYLKQVHQSLNYLFEENFRIPSVLEPGNNQFHPFLLSVRGKIEQAWQKFELDRVTLSVEDIPRSPNDIRDFVIARWGAHRASTHPLFDFLEHEATPRDFKYFFAQEAAVSTRFGDIIAMSLVGAHQTVSSTLAKNLWDEMGHGNLKNQHSRMFVQLLDVFKIKTADDAAVSTHCIENHDWRVAAGYNHYVFMALHRRNYFRNLGSLGVGEIIVPPQCEKIVSGGLRAGLAKKNPLKFYFDHIEADVEHGTEWRDCIIIPLCAEFPHLAYEILVGAEMGLNTAADYYDAVHEYLRK